MPLILLHTAAGTEEKRQSVLRRLSAIVGETLGKPEHYVMAVHASAEILLGGTTRPSALVDVRSIGGLSAAVNRELSRKISAALAEGLGIPADRVYLTFSDVKADHWGWNANTFG